MRLKRTIVAGAAVAFALTAGAAWAQTSKGNSTHNSGANPALAPGRAGTSPGQAGTTPGQTGMNPGQNPAVKPPGQTFSTPGNTTKGSTSTKK